MKKQNIKGKMSAVSVTSSKREQGIQEAQQELEALRAMNTTLRAYLDHLRNFSHNLKDMNKKCKQLSKINSQWIDTLEKI